MGLETPGNQGLYIGKVENFNMKNNTILVKLKNMFKLEKGDGVAFQSPNKNSNEIKTYGMALENRPKYKGNKLVLNVGRPVTVGSKLYLTRSISLNHEAKSIIKNDIEPSIPIDVEMSWDNELKAHIKGEFIGFDNKKHTVQLKSHYRMEKALKRPLKRDQIEKQLQKTGKTPFIIRRVSIEYPGDLFSPTSKLNQFRREFLEKSRYELLKTYKPSDIKVKLAENRYKEFKLLSSDIEDSDVKLHTIGITMSVYSDSLETVKGALEGGAKRIYFEPNPAKNFNYNCNPCSQNPEHSFKKEEDLDQIGYNTISTLLSSARKLCNEYDAKFIWKWPQITHQHQINNYYKILESQIEIGLKGLMVDGLGAATSVQQATPHIKLYGSAGLNILNNKTVLLLSKIFNTLTLSAELTKEV